MRSLQRAAAVFLSADCLLYLSLFPCEVLAEKSADTSLVKMSSLPLRTKGRDIVDSEGKVVNLNCVNWYGAHLEQMVMNGLDKRSLSDFAGSIVQLLFNCVRLPFSLEMARWTGVVPNASSVLAANAELHGFTPLEVFDHTVAALTKAGLMVILNVHNSNNGWCCSESDGDGLWYTSEYPEESFFETIEAMGKRYLSDPLVVGFDLRNEIRTSSLGVPDWGSGSAKSDWSLAAAKAGSLLVSVNDNMLVIVSGLNYGMFLCDVPTKPLHIKHQALNRRVVYTAHYYNWYYSDASAFRDVASHLITTYLITLFVLLIVVPLATRPGQASHHRPHEGLKFTRLVHAVGSTAVLVGSLMWANHLPSSCRFSETVYPLSLLFIFPQCLCSLFLWAKFLAIALDLIRDLLLLGRSRSVVLSSTVRPRILGPVTEDSGSEKEDDWLSETVRNQLAGGISILAARRSKLGIACIVLSFCLLSALVVFRTKLLSYETFASELDARWGFLLKSRPGSSEDSSSVAPVWLGEFGTDVQDTDWQYLIRYMRERRVGFAYWPINGVKWPIYGKGIKSKVVKDEPYGLLQQDERTIRDAWKLEALQDLIREQR